MILGNKGQNCKIAFFPNDKNSGSVTHREFLRNFDHSAYIVSEKYGTVWRFYEKVIEFALFPVWVARPLTFHLVNLYGNLAQVSVGSLILLHHLFLMWCYFIGYSIISSFIGALKKGKLFTKTVFGTENEVLETNELKLMMKATNYDDWLAHVGKYENAKRAPGLLQPTDKRLIATWRKNASESRLAREFSSPIRRVSTPIGVPDPHKRKKNKDIPLWNVVGLSISEWRRFPLLESFHPQVESFTSITSQLKLNLKNLRSILPALLRGDSTLSNVEAKILRNVKVILSRITEWSVTRVGNPDLLFGITYLGSHDKIEEQYELVVMLLNEMLVLVIGLEEHGLLDEIKLHKLCGDIHGSLTSFKKTFGITALALSGGGRLAFSHMGVLDTLKETGCVPKVISGSSGGSILASFFCCLDQKEYEIVKHRVGSLCRKLIPSLKDQMKNRSQFGYNLDYTELAATLREILKDVTFEEVMLKTGYLLCINATPANLKSGLRCPLLMNAYTTPNVIVWSGVLASCCLPILLPPVRLLTKRTCSKFLPKGTKGEVMVDSNEIFIPDGTPNTGIDSCVLSLLDNTIDPSMVIEPPDPEDPNSEYITGTCLSPYAPVSMRWCDGSLSNDIPTKELQRLLGAREIISSQVNPHHAYFLNYSPHEEQYSALSGSSMEGALYAARKYFELGVRQRYNMATSVLLSPYIDGQDITEFFSELGVGTINISPCAMQDLHKVAQAPTDEELEEALKLAQIRTWPHIARIKSRMRIEQALCKVDMELTRIISRCREDYKSFYSATDDSEVIYHDKSELFCD